MLRYKVLYSDFLCSLSQTISITVKIKLGRKQRFGSILFQFLSAFGQAGEQKFWENGKCKFVPKSGQKRHFDFWPTSPKKDLVVA
jgi:hypothetical protein